MVMLIRGRHDDKTAQECPRIFGCNLKVCELTLVLRFLSSSSSSSGFCKGNFYVWFLYLITHHYHDISPPMNIRSSLDIPMSSSRNNQAIPNESLLWSPCFDQVPTAGAPPQGLLQGRSPRRRQWQGIDDMWVSRIGGIPTWMVYHGKA